MLSPRSQTIEQNISKFASKMKRALLIAVSCMLALSISAQEKLDSGRPDFMVRGGLEFPDAPLRDLLKYYQYLVKASVLVHIDIDLKMKVTVMTPDDMTYAEAKAFIQDTLLKNHRLVLRETGSGEVLLTQAKEPKPAHGADNRKP